MHGIKMTATMAAITMAAMAVSTTCTATSAMAQVSRADQTKGLMIGAHLNGSAIKFGQIRENSSAATTGSGADGGGGGGVQVGWGFSRWLMVYGGIDIAAINVEGLNDLVDEEFRILPGDYNLAHADIGVRFSLPTEKKLVPYASIAFTQRVVSAQVLEDEIKLSGPGLTVGAGVQFFFTPKIALDANLQFSAGKFTEADVLGVKIDLDKFAEVDNSTSGRLNVGVKFYPHFGGKQ